jgi:hypothetical protein
MLNKKKPFPLSWNGFFVIFMTIGWGKREKQGNVILFT